LAEAEEWNSYQGAQNQHAHTGGKAFKGALSGL
jgi:hypothetical protein